MTLPNYTVCRNPFRGPHECHPSYARRYDGYCLDCENAGVPEAVEEIAVLKAERDKLREALQKIAVIPLAPSCGWLNALDAPKIAATALARCIPEVCGEGT